MQGEQAVRDRKPRSRPPQFLSLSLWETGCSSIASSSRWNSPTINSNRLRIAVSIIAAAKPFARAIREMSTSTSGMAFTSVEHSLPATVPQTKMPKLQRRRERKSLRTQGKLMLTCDHNILRCPRLSVSVNWGLPDEPHHHPRRDEPCKRGRDHEAATTTAGSGLLGPGAP